MSQDKSSVSGSSENTSGGGTSGVALPPRSRMRETQTVSADKFFEYLGYHFTPEGISDYNITMNGRKQYMLIEWCSPALFGIHDSIYSQKSFCEVAKTSIPDVDVYYCRETAKFYIPGERSLFEYNGKVHTFLRDADKEDSMQKEERKRRERPPVLSRKW